MIKKILKNTNKVLGSISFQNVSFSYSDDNNYVLNNISMEIIAGQTVAFVGPSGAGKSSLLNLVPRFYDTSAGKIIIGGEDIKDLMLSDLTNEITDFIALAEQDFNSKLANTGYNKMINLFFKRSVRILWLMIL